MEIILVKNPVKLSVAKEAAEKTYGDMVKAVVDVNKKIIALGGEMHADCEIVLLEDGSNNEDIWGFNIYPDKNGNERLEFTSLINIRPRMNNKSMEIKDESLRQRIVDIVSELIIG